MIRNLLLSDAVIPGLRNLKVPFLNEGFIPFPLSDAMNPLCNMLKLLVGAVREPPLQNGTGIIPKSNQKAIFCHSERREASLF
jgi:hypothetical protein